MLGSLSSEGEAPLKQPDETVRIIAYDRRCRIFARLVKRSQGTTLIEQSHALKPSRPFYSCASSG